MFVFFFEKFLWKIFGLGKIFWKCCAIIFGCVVNMLDPDDGFTWHGNFMSLREIVPKKKSLKPWSSRWSLGHSLSNQNRMTGWPIRMPYIVARKKGRSHAKLTGLSGKTLCWVCSTGAADLHPWMIFFIGKASGTIQKKCVYLILVTIWRWWNEVKHTTHKDLLGFGGVRGGFKILL